MKRAIAAIALGCTLTACGSATDHVTFAPPPAYKATVSIGPLVQMWSGPGSSTIMLMALPTKLDLSKSIEPSTVRGAKVQAERHITICGDQPAVDGKMIGNSALGSKNRIDKPQQIEFIATDVSGKTYMAMYMRPSGSPADGAAETAIHNVCPKGN